MSLPLLLGTTLASVPADVPYLSANPALTAKWRQRLGSLGGFTVGLVWQGNVHHKGDRHRSVPLARMAPLARVEGVRLVSLQKGPGTEQLTALSGQLGITDLGDELDAAGRLAGLRTVEAGTVDVRARNKKDQKSVTIEQAVNAVKDELSAYRL